ncbi:protein-export chaperone SecB [Neobacillus sp. BF23-41]|uniref:protein-export chaperone SecB n=1 Tax=Neobacillus sp. BF23-41 TaxID=3240280 RepID=UPI0034E3D907
MVQGVMSFEGYQVDSINYEKSNSNQNGNYTKLSPEFFIVKAEKENNDEHFNIIMGVKIDDSDKDNILPFTAEVVVRGFYTFNTEDAVEHNIDDIDDIHIFKLVNGSAILYPYLRSVLTDITSKSMHNPIILPTINFNKFITNRNLEDMLLDSSHYQDINEKHTYQD